MTEFDVEVGRRPGWGRAPVGVQIESGSVSSDRLYSVSPSSICIQDGDRVHMEQEIDGLLIGSRELHEGITYLPDMCISIFASLTVTSRNSFSFFWSQIPPKYPQHKIAIPRSVGLLNCKAQVYTPLRAEFGLYRPRFDMISPGAWLHPLSWETLREIKTKQRPTTPAHLAAGGLQLRQRLLCMSKQYTPRLCWSRDASAWVDSIGHASTLMSDIQDEVMGRKSSPKDVKFQEIQRV